MRKPKHVVAPRPVAVADIRAFFRPCVYGWKRSGSWMYVGCSTKGLSRLANHHAIAPSDLGDSDELVTWTVDGDSHEELFNLESWLIATLRPTLNGGARPWEHRRRQRREAARQAVMERLTHEAEKAAIAHRRKFGTVIRGESETDLTKCVGETTEL